MKILITGGAGFIGSNLVKFHLDKKDYVWMIDNLITGSKNNVKEFLSSKNFRFIEADIIDFDYSGLPSFDVIYNLASPASPKQFLKIPIEILKTNSLGTMKILDFFIKSNSRCFLYASTSEVYGNPLIDPQPETYFGNVNSVGIRSCYDESKRFAESYLMTNFRKFSLNLRIARIFNTYGPKMAADDGRVVSNFINQIINHQPLTVYGDGKQTRSFCYVDDMVKGLYLLATLPNLAGTIVNLGNPQKKTILAIANLIKKLTNSPVKITFQKIGEDDPKKRCPDISKARILLGWEPKITLGVGLKKTIKYFQSLK